ncbi:MAG: class I SAM-dependent methyltransferase [Candidatus Woesearchaeota archaeon]|nr:class I SAM-dependent methyltransferase [Candidatus Woesearchaeota archaeon]
MIQLDQEKIQAIEKAHKSNTWSGAFDDRSIDDYDFRLSQVRFSDARTFATVDALLETFQGKGSLCWIDYACGKGVALREGTSRYNASHDEKVLSLGADIRRIEGVHYSDEIVLNAAQPIFFQHDLDSGILGNMAPNLISCYEGLIYIEDPIRLIEGMYGQLDSQGYMFFTWNSHIRYDFTFSLESHMEWKFRLNDISFTSAKIEGEDKTFFLVQKTDASPRKISFDLMIEPGLRDARTAMTSPRYFTSQVYHRWHR